LPECQNFLQQRLSSLSFLYNYFDGPTKLFLDTVAKSFFLCSFYNIKKKKL